MRADAVQRTSLRQAKAKVEVERFDCMQCAKVTGARMVPRTLRDAIKAVAVSQHCNEIVKAEVRALRALRAPFERSNMRARARDRDRDTLSVLPPRRANTVVTKPSCRSRQSTPHN